MLANGRLSAGDVLWSESSESLRMSLVLEPEVERRRCGEMLFLMMVAFGDAAGAISCTGSGDYLSVAIAHPD